MKNDVFHRCPSCGFNFLSEGLPMPEAVVIIREVPAAALVAEAPPVFSSVCKHEGCDFATGDGEVFNAHMRAHDERIHAAVAEQEAVAVAASGAAAVAGETAASKLARARAELKAVSDEIELHATLQDLEDAKAHLADLAAPPATGGTSADAQ